MSRKKKGQQQKSLKKMLRGLSKADKNKLRQKMMKLPPLEKLIGDLSKGHKRGDPIAGVHQSPYKRWRSHY